MGWQLDPMHTQVGFAVKHFGMMTVRGHFNEVAATGTIDPNNPAASRTEVTIDAASLTTNNAQRDNDLKGSYFLELDKHPKITFRSTKIEPAGQDRFVVTGDLTIKGKTKEVTFDVTAKRDGSDLTATATANPSWKFGDFGMTAPSVPFRVLSVTDEIRAAIEIVATGPKG